MGARGEVPDDLELPEGVMRQLQQVSHTVLKRKKKERKSMPLGVD